ncbi:MAG: bis-aminopropyl spermidine synthase family protein, partial [Candidatus Hodarchaeales archaeon]
MNPIMNFTVQSDPDFILNCIATNANIAEGPSAIRDVLLQIYRNKNINNKKLSRLTEIPVPILAAIRGELKSANILQNNTNFTPVGKIWVEQRLGFHIDTINLSEKLSINSVPESIIDSNKLIELEKWINRRPPPKFELDQSRATFETQLKRFLLLLKNGDIEGRKILFLGDDDATSLLLSVSKIKCKIFVIDIDERILSYLSEATQTIGGIQIKTLLHDLRDQLPENWQHSFDVVFTDPPYTQPGANLFFQRGREALKS